MTEREKLALIYRLTTGYTILDNYIIDTPSETVLNESYYIYDKFKKINGFEEWLKSSSTEAYLIRYKQWQFTYNQEIEDLSKSLNNAKHILYLKHGSPGKEVEQIRKQIKLINSRREELLNKKHMFDRYTLEGYADYFTDLFIFSNVILDKNYNKVELSEFELTFIMNKYKKNAPSVTDLRFIAKTDPWRTFWNDNPSPFRVLGDNQKTLALFSKMYDNVYAHSDRPNEEIINDDDMLDGWFIEMQAKVGKAKSTSFKNQIDNKYPNAQEIFISPRDRNGVVDNDMIKQINDLNDIRGHVIRKRIDEGVKKGNMTILDIPEMKLDLLAGAKNG